MTEPTPTITDAIDDAAFKRWLQVVQGTWSSADWKVFLSGYREGWFERGRVKENDDDRT